MEKIRPRRSVLFMPGSNARAIEKARTLDCDVVALDLEDAVAPEDKEKARLQVVEALKSRDFGGKKIAVRVNPLSSPFGHADLEAMAKAHPDVVILPKVTSAAEVGAEHRAIPSSIAVWAMIETPKAVMHLDQIAGAGAAALILGSNDLMKEMRATPMEGRENLHTTMSLLVLAARAHGIAAIDGTHNSIADGPGFEASCRQGRAFGFDGKTLIHPSQIEAANRIFAPSEAELQDARAVIAAFAQNPGKNVLALNGRMVERLHAEEAETLLALAEAIQKR